MSKSKVFVLDANIFIESAKRFYAFDLAPAFWTGLIHHARAGRIISIDRVKQEIDRFGKTDPLMVWIAKNFSQYCVTTQDNKVLSNYGKLMMWSQEQTVPTDAAKREFARAMNADPWLIALAMAKNYTVVTFEQFDPKTRKKILIPNVCQAHSVAWTTPYEMMRELGITLG